MTHKQIIQAVIDRISTVQRFDMEAVAEWPCGGFHTVEAFPDENGKWIRVSDIEAAIADIQKFNA